MSPPGPTSRTRWRRVIAFVAVAFAFSWAQWIAVIASQHHWIASKVTLGPLAIFGPLVGAIAVMTSAADDRRRWLRSLVAWRMPPRVAIAAVAGPPLLFIACLAAATALTPGARAVPMPPARTIVTICAGMLLTAGIGEESGWRGFLLPELRRSFGPIAASSIVAAVWFAWHLPLFWIDGATQRQLPPAAFALGILSYSLILTRLVESANGSTLVAMLFHSSANVGLVFAMLFVRTLPQYPLLAIAYVGVLAVAAVFSRDRFAPSNRSPTTAARRDTSSPETGWRG